MTYIFRKWLKYLRNGKIMWEMTQICIKWLKYVEKLLNYMTNGLKCGKRLRDLGNGQNIWVMAQIHATQL